MKYLMALLFLVYAKSGYTQAAPDFIMGKWQVEQVLLPKNIPPKMLKLLNKTAAIYAGARFYFAPDTRFTLIAKDSENSIENGYWVYTPVTKSIKIYNRENEAQGKTLLLEFSAMQRPDGSTYFSLQEEPITLKLKKE